MNWLQIGLKMAVMVDARGLQALQSMHRSTSGRAAGSCGTFKLGQEAEAQTMWKRQ